MFDFSLDVALFLQAKIGLESENKTTKFGAVAVHCKAGKGRTGVMICAFMFFSRLFPTMDLAIAHYNHTRTTDRQGITIGSQIRYLKLFESFLNKKLQINFFREAISKYDSLFYHFDRYETFSMILHSITLGPFKRACNLSALNLQISVLQKNGDFTKVYDYKQLREEGLQKEPQEHLDCLILKFGKVKGTLPRYTGDLRFQFTMEDISFYFWVNVFAMRNGDFDVEEFHGASINKKD